LDINRSRKNELRFGKGDFCVYSVLDDAKQYRQTDIQTAFYFTLFEQIKRESN